jgi:hypothetical protein
MDRGPSTMLHFARTCACFSRYLIFQVLIFSLTTVPLPTEEKKGKPEFPEHSEVLKDYEKIISTADGKKSLYSLWTRKKDNQMLAELPRGFDKQKHFIALTVASGDIYAGLQAGDMYAYWRRYDKTMALVEPNYTVRSTGHAESRSSVQRLFTDRVLLEGADRHDRAGWTAGDRPG